MAHVPHIYLPRPWDGSRIEVPAATRHHLDRVLRASAEIVVSYTDGRGVAGSGRYAAGVVTRGEETGVPHPGRGIAVAVAPPKATDRQRFLVEKLAELGVASLVWLETRYTQGRPAPARKATAWAIGAMEQSRGAHLLQIRGPETIDAVETAPGGVVVADPSGEPDLPAGDLTLVIGPEGGWAPGELPHDSKRVSLGSTILRTETAAVVAAVRALTRDIPGTPAAG